MSDNLIEIDGSQGEGGGQILRTSVSLAAALGKPVRVANIRANRKPPGLRPQHVAAVRAAAAICGGRLEGDAVDSRELTFVPGELQSGTYRFDIGTAGSTSLVLQTVIPGLWLCDGDSEVVVTGGTHNPLAPTFEYLRDVFGVLVATAGMDAYFEMRRAGFYPAGGGEVVMHLRGLEFIDDARPIRLTDRGPLTGVTVLSAASEALRRRLIVERQAGHAGELLAEQGHKPQIEQAHWDTASPGTTTFVRAVFGRSVAGFSSLGALGKPAEKVAAEAAADMLAFLKTGAAVDAHAADQLLVLAALSDGESHYTAQCATEHLRTNAAVVTQITGREVNIETMADGVTRVVVSQVT